jgi:hypothetical protein
VSRTPLTPPQQAEADAVCHLRALFKSEPGQWQAFWATAA